MSITELKSTDDQKTEADPSRFPFDLPINNMFENGGMGNR